MVLEADWPLRGPRAWLRAITPADLDAFHALCVHPFTRRFLFDDQPIGRDQAQALIEASQASFGAHGYGVWLLGEHGSERMCGFAGLLAADGAPNLVVALRVEACGRGLGSEAARAVLDHALGCLRLPAVAADVDEPNLASLRLIERLGMRPTGRKVVNGRPLLYFVTP